MADYLDTSYTPPSPSHRKNSDCCSLDNLNPKNWSSRDVVKASLTVFVVSLLLLTVAALSHHYPAASGAFLTIFSLGTGIGLIVFAISCVKCQRIPPRTSPLKDK